MLKRVSIQNFKSLKDVTLDLQKVNLLIGPNNSGKTNFLKALEFFVSNNFNSHVLSDLQKISYKHKEVSLIGEFEFEPDPLGVMAKNYNTYGYDVYHFVQTYSVKKDVIPYEVSEEKKTWFTQKDGTLTEGKVEGGHLREFYDFARTRIFRPDPTKLIHEAKLAGGHTELASDGSNLIPFYFSIFNNYEKNANQIQADLAKCIPEIIRFRTPPVNGEGILGLKFFDKDEIGYWANEVSEGVLYFLILLCIINQPNPPKLLLLEEPEKGIHPRRIREVMDFIFRLAEEKDVQIILTTHNEHVLDDFSTRPESVFVFDKDEEGATYVRNLQRDIIEPTNARNKELGLDDIDLTTNLSENWLYGLLGGVPSIL